MYRSALRDDRAMTDGPACLVQCVAEDCQEHNWCYDTLEHEKILNLRIWYAQEWKLEQEVEQESNHSGSSDTLIFGYSVGYVGKAWPDSCE